MTNEDIIEAAELAGFGNPMPEKFRVLIDRYVKFKSVFTPNSFTLEDFATCATIFSLFKKKD